MTPFDFVAGFYAATASSLFVLWIFGLMAAVLAACLIVWAFRSVAKLINHWRFLYWLNQLHR